MTERIESVELNETDVRELSWVADVLEYGADDGGDLSVHELNDLAGVIRSKLPANPVVYTTDYTVRDVNGAEYKMLEDGRWFLVRGDQALEVPYESILDPVPVSYVVVR